ncbi:hypothetical protein EDD16DRAFT_1240487 [Pisolithus croceorrhizus]|nr:hypothetical protein EDD16DRAFT_1240487 [Pisolithus croceorrhizus]
MRLLDVCAVLKRERDIQQAGSKTEVLKQADDETEEYAEVLKQFDDEANKYAIVSHRWGIRTEVNFDGITRLMEMNEKDRDKVRDRDGYRKIIKSCEKAEEDGHRWLWIDTCCIDKRNSVELSEAICSMYRWYSNSQTCYVYLNNVDESVFPTEQDFSKFRTSNGWPEWFSRGWTLQELIAPTELEFFNKSWVSIGTKQDLTSTLEDITRIPVKVLGGGRMSASRPRRNFAQMMSWAADRKTTRVEDRAYSLMGLFGVNMPMMYGEGPKAFQRLQLEILRVASDHTILAWNPKGTWSAGSVLADDPSCFRDCHDIQNMDLDEFVHKVGGYMRRNMPGKVIDWIKLSRLRRRMRSLQLSRWDVTNLGIRVTLPVLPHRDLPKLFFRVMLPCCDGYGNLITIDIFSGNDRSYRWSYSTWLTVGSVPVLKSLYVPYVARTVESRHDLRLHDRRAFWHGFTRCGTLPCEIVGNVVTLPSQGTTLYVFVYANNDGSRFAVGIGYFLDRLWAHIVCDEHPAKQEALSWVDFANRVYDHLRNPSSSGRSHVRKNSTAIWDAHLPQTIWDARVFCCSNGVPALMAPVDVKQSRLS